MCSTGQLYAAIDGLRCSRCRLDYLRRLNGCLQFYRRLLLVCHSILWWKFQRVEHRIFLTLIYKSAVAAVTSVVNAYDSKKKQVWPSILFSVLFLVWFRCRLYYIRFQYRNFRARKLAEHSTGHMLTDGVKWLTLAIVATVLTVTSLLTYFFMDLYCCLL